MSAYDPPPAPEYADDYGTCKRCSVSLVLYHESSEPAVVSGILGLAPHHIYSAEPRRVDRRSSNTSDVVDAVTAAKPSCWVLSSDGVIESRDVRRHLDWLLSLAGTRGDALRQLRAVGWRASVTVFWVSATGHGGPVLEPYELAALGELGLPIWFDIYFTDREPPR